MPPQGKSDTFKTAMSSNSNGAGANAVHDKNQLYLDRTTNRYRGIDTPNSPLAPSVEKAYYRKCIELKRRLNEVEAANDEAKIKRVRLDRAIMKMRLERAFLLDELRKRMDYNPDGSEASGDEGMTTVCQHDLERACLCH